jgi:hypothetical protein
MPFPSQPAAQQRHGLLAKVPLLFGQLVWSINGANIHAAAATFFFGLLAIFFRSALLGSLH